MKDRRNYRVSAGGIILLVTTAFGLLSELGSILSNLMTYISQDGVIAGILLGLRMLTALINSGLILTFAIMLTAKAHNMGLTVMAAVALGVHFLNSTLGSFSAITTQAALMPQYLVSSVVRLMCFLAYDAFLLVLVLLCAKATGKDPASARKMGSLPGILYIVYAFLSAANTALLYPVSANGVLTAELAAVVITSIVASLLAAVLPTVAWFLTGSWIVNPYKKGVQPQQPYPGGAPREGSQQPNPAGLQELERYQQMLSSGVITQEEYNAARARILGL